MPAKKFIVVLILSQIVCLSCLYAENQDESEVYYTVSAHGPKGLFRIDKNGEIQWSLTGLKHPQQFDIDSAGNIFVSETNGAKYFSANKELLWQYAAPQGTENPVAKILKDGRFLVGNEGLCKLLEINSKGETLKEIQFTSSFKQNHGQFRFCQKTAEGTYLVPFTMENAVREYDGDGKVVYDFGNFNLPVGVLRLLNGHTLIGSKARVDELDKDGKNIWSFDTVKDGGLKEAVTTGLLRLENGNTVITYYHDMQDVPDIIEVSADKKIVRSVTAKDLNHVAMVKRVDKKGNPFKDAAATPDPGLLHADLGFEEIVFVKRKPYSSDHNYTMAYNGTSADRFLAENGIYTYNLKTKQTRAIITAADMPGGKGVIGKFSLSFDGTKAVFDYRKDISSAFRIWEVNTDGSGLRQLTFAPKDEAEKVSRYGVEYVDASYRPNYGDLNFHTDDIQPCYLPDGGIAFTSSRCEIGVLCFTQPLAATLVLHRMDADGGNIEQLTQSPVSEFSPTVLDDGRILYHRWEYIDKGARVAKTFWAMNPDGTKSEELFGLSDSEYATGAFTYPKPVPGDTPMIVCSVGPHYPQGNSVGPIKLIDLSKDNRTSAPLTNITPDVEVHSSQGGWIFAATDFKAHSGDGIGGPLYGHPYPINEKQFLVSHKDNESEHYMASGAYSIYIIDTEGNKAFVYEDEDSSVSCWHPTPLLAIETPVVIAPSVSPELKKKSQAVCIVTNVYEGMEGVEAGSVKYIRINEAIPQYWDTKRKWAPNYHSAYWSGALWPRVQWGIVPVEKDGSAYFTVPADRNIFFQSLDENYMEVQRERTYVNYRPGEIRTCVGCHERSTDSPRPMANRTPLALKRAPSVPGPQPGESDARQVIDYPADIQPILDAKCVSCHGSSKPDGGLMLTGDITARHNVSFEQIRNKGLAGPLLSEFIAPNGSDHANMHGGYLPPKSLGSYKSGLVSTIRTKDSDDPHYQLLTQAEMLKIIRWTDSNYQFYGSYYGRHHGAHKDHPEFRRKATFEEAISPIAPKWHN